MAWEFIWEPLPNQLLEGEFVSSALDLGGPWDFWWLISQSRQLKHVLVAYPVCRLLDIACEWEIDMINLLYWVYIKLLR